MAYWLLKSEPSAFSIDDLATSADATTCWDGVRNYQARNFMRDEMKCGDLAFFYHSSCPEPGIAGIAEIVREAYPDPTAFDPQDKHYDARSNADSPTWLMVDIRLQRKIAPIIALSELRKYADNKLEGLQLLMRGNRLSVMPIAKRHWNFILKMDK